MATQGCGEIITWTVRGAFIKRADMVMALQAEGLKAPVKKTRTATYLHRALEQCISDSLIRKIGEDGTHVAYAAVRETRDLKHNDYSSDVKEAVRLNKATGDLEFKRDTSLTRAIREGMIHSEGGLLSAEVGGVFKGVVVIDCNATSLRDTGGVYFVPSIYSPMIDALERVIKKVKNQGCTIRLQRLRVYAGKREVRDLAEIFAETIMSEVNQAADDMREALKDLGKVRASTFAKRAAEFRATMKKITEYESTLTGIKFTNEAAECERTINLLKKMENKCRAEREKNRQQKMEFV